MSHTVIVTDTGCDLDGCSLADIEVESVRLEAAEAFESTLPYEPSFDVVDERLTRDLVATYERAWARGAESIVSVHTSSRLAGAYHAALAACARVRDLLQIAVVDSGQCGMALGFVLLRVAQARANGAATPDIAAVARRAARNVHSMFFAESLSRVHVSQKWLRVHDGHVAGNGSRPLMAVEDGEMLPLERVRTRACGFDRLAEFVELFPRVDALAIYHDARAADLESLVERIIPVFPREQIIFGSYGPTLRARLGPRAIGVFVDQGLDSEESPVNRR